MRARRIHPLTHPGERTRRPSHAFATRVRAVPDESRTMREAPGGSPNVRCDRLFSPGSFLPLQSRHSRCVSSSDSTIKLWDAATAKLLRTFENHSSNVHSMASAGPLSYFEVHQPCCLLHFADLIAPRLSRSVPLLSR